MSFRCQQCHAAFPNDQSVQYSPHRIVTKLYPPAPPFAGLTVAEEKLVCASCASANAGPEVLGNVPNHIIEAAHQRENERRRLQDRQTSLARLAARKKELQREMN
jgi:Fe-S-cluster-containing hydrogenase component 2